MAILFAFGGIQRRKGRRIMNANHPVLIFGIKNQPKTFMAVHFRDETQIRRIGRITVCVRIHSLLLCVICLSGPYNVRLGGSISCDRDHTTRQKAKNTNHPKRDWF